MGQLETLRSFAEHTFRIAFEHLNEPARFENYCKTSFSTEQLRSEIEHTSSSFWFGWEGEDLAAYLKLNCGEWGRMDLLIGMCLVLVRGYTII